MKNKGFKFKFVMLTILILSMLQVKTMAYGETYVDKAITIDGYFDDWQDKPHMDVKWGWSSKAAHKVSLFRDEKNVYLHVQMSEDFYKQFNGYNYNFILDGKETSFAAVYDKGDVNSLGDGIYKITVRSQNGYYPVGEGYITRKRGQSDNAEIVIPISAFGNGINPESVKTIEFYTPNLGPQHVISTGTSSGPYIAVGLGCLIACGGYFNFNKKRKNA